VKSSILLEERWLAGVNDLQLRVANLEIKRYP
jgi:hypothetical protein